MYKDFPVSSFNLTDSPVNLTGQLHETETMFLIIINSTYVGS